MYRLSENIDKNKIFIVNRSEIEGRLDPYFYKYEFEQLRVLFENKGFIRIGDVLNSWNRGDGPRDGFYTNDNNGVFFLRVNNLKDNTISLTDVKFIHRHIHDKNLKRTQVKAGDLIFAISGTKDNLGTVSIIPDNIKEANLNSALVRLDLDSNRILNEFFCILFDLKFIRTQIDFIGKGTAQNNLNNKEITSIKIPNFSIEKQREIVSYFSNKKILVKQKEAEAQRLLDSIDNYLLEELGIVLPNEKDLQITEYDTPYGFAFSSENPLIKNGHLFLASSREVSGGRIDPKYYTDSFKSITNAISKSKYKIDTIKRYCYFLSGYAFSSDDYVRKSECHLITIKNILNGRIEIDNVTYLPNDYYEIYSKFRIRHNDLVIAMTGNTGKVGLFNCSLKALLNQRNGIIRSSKLNTIFLMNLLNTKIYQTLILRNSVGGVQPNISENDIMKLYISIPPIEIQNEIADKISQIRAKALQLQQEATQILEQTKLQIEQMVLGN